MDRERESEEDEGMVSGVMIRDETVICEEESYKKLEPEKKRELEDLEAAIIGRSQGKVDKVGKDISTCNAATTRPGAERITMVSEAGNAATTRLDGEGGESDIDLLRQQQITTSEGLVTAHVVDENTDVLTQLEELHQSLSHLTQRQDDMLAARRDENPPPNPLPVCAEIVDTHQAPNRRMMFLYGGIMIVVVTVIVVVVAVVVATSRNVGDDRGGEEKDEGWEDLDRCFVSSLSLQKAVDVYLGRGDTELNNTADIGTWCVSGIQDFSRLFSADRNENADSFNADISKWDLSSATDLSYMFESASSFDQDLWQVSNTVETLEGMFIYAASFQQNISNWDVSSVKTFAWMFEGATSFDQDLAGWEVRSATDLSYMFDGASSFNGDVSTWDISRVTAMPGIFSELEYFDQPLPWRTENVTDMRWVFAGATSFNQPLAWDTSKVKDMRWMFEGASSFNQESLSSWNVASADTMEGMFLDAVAFNVDLAAWNLSRASNVAAMFEDATSFNRNLCAWGALLPRDASVTNMFRGTACAVTADPNLSAVPPGPFCQPCI